MAAHQAQLSARIADDLTVTYGVRADNPGFEKLIRVLSFFKDKSAPPTAGEVSAGQALLDEALAAIDETKTNLTMDQLTLADQRKTHQTTTNLAKNHEAELIQTDQTDMAAQVNALKISIEASYKLLAALRDISLLKYLG